MRATRDRGARHRRASSRYEPADMTVTVGAGTPFAELDAVARRARAGVPARPARPERDGRRRARVRAVGHPPAAARAGPRPGARGALRHRRRPRREGRRADGEERDRLRPAPAHGRLVRHARRARAGDAALPAARAGRASGSAPTDRHRERCYRPASMLWDGDARVRAGSKAPPPTSTRNAPRTSTRHRRTDAPRGPAPRPDLGRARRGRPRSPPTLDDVRWCAESASAPCTSPPTRPTRCAPRATAAHAARRLDAARSRRRRHRRLRPRRSRTAR